MKKSVTISEGTKTANGKQLFKWSYTLREEGDYDTGKITYHELHYAIDKSIAVVGEEESEKWIDVNQRDLNSLPTLDFFEYLLLFVKEWEEKK